MSSKNTRKSVLIVDDQENWRQLLSDVLEDHFDITVASDLREGWDAILAKEVPFHVVSTDLRLIDNQPGNEDGLLMVEFVNRLGDTTQVIVLTGYPTLSTVKRSYRELQVFDYLEKAPEGKTFDLAGYIHRVTQAAEKAEKNRPHGFTLPRLWVLVVGGTKQWREKLVGLLRKYFYDVDELANPAELVPCLESSQKEYQLVIFDDDVLQQQTDFFRSLHQHLPDAKKIMFTSQKIEPIVRLMQEQTILNVLTQEEGQFDALAFKETLRRVFAPEATRYAVASIYEMDQPERKLADGEPLHVGRKYRLELTLQNERQAGATALWLIPKREKQARVTFKVFVYAPGVILDPDSEAYWSIPASGAYRPFITEMTPQTTSKKITLTIEVEQDNGWVWRLCKDLAVEE